MLDVNVTMRTITATILDATHLELSQPIEAMPGDVIQVALALESDDDLAVWRDAAMRHLSDAYADEDAEYDEL